MFVSLISLVTNKVFFWLILSILNSHLLLMKQLCFEQYINQKLNYSKLVTHLFKVIAKPRVSIFHLIYL